MQALWNGAVLAESQATKVIEGNHYFPPASINPAYFLDSDTQTICSWKGVAHYKTVVVEGKRNPDAAWYYPEPKQAAAEIRDHIAFWHGVEVTE